MQSKKNLWVFEALRRNATSERKNVVVDEVKDLQTRIRVCGLLSQIQNTEM